MNPARDLTVSTSAEHQPSGQQMVTHLRWDPSDPLVVALVFVAPTGPVTWLVGREQLASGLRMPTGLFDLRITPEDGDLLLLRLDNGQQQAKLTLPAGPVRDLLARSYQRVPLGAEFGEGREDTDLALRWLLIQGGA